MSDIECKTCGISKPPTEFSTKGKGKSIAMELLTSGKALDKMKQIIEIQGGDPQIINEIPRSQFQKTVECPRTGYVTQVDNAKLIKIARLAGAPEDKTAGIVIFGKRGDKIKKDKPLIKIFSN